MPLPFPPALEWAGGDAAAAAGGAATGGGGGVTAGGAVGAGGTAATGTGSGAAAGGTCEGGFAGGAGLEGVVGLGLGEVTPPTGALVPEPSPGTGLGAASLDPELPVGRTTGSGADGLFATWRTRATRSSGRAMLSLTRLVGSSGNGAGESRGKLSWAKIATSAKALAAVSPRKAKAVLRILSGKPLPAKLGSRRESSLLWWLEFTTCCIDPGRPHPSDWIEFLDFRFDHLSTLNPRDSTSMTIVPSRSVRSVGTRCCSSAVRVAGAGCP